MTNEFPPTGPHLDTSQATDESKDESSQDRKHSRTESTKDRKFSINSRKGSVSARKESTASRRDSTPSLMHQTSRLSKRDTQACIDEEMPLSSDQTNFSDASSRLSVRESFKPSLIRQVTLLLPVFILQMCSGLSGGYTAVLLVTLSDPSASTIYGKQLNMSLDYEKLLVNVEEIAPPVTAILSGYLQNWLGPRAVLKISCLPLLLSYLAVGVAPNISVIILGRLLVGVANGLLQTNVYLPEVAHPASRDRLYMVEGAVRSLGMIAAYTLGLFLSQWYHIALLASFMPLVSFIGLLLIPESPLFLLKIATLKADKKSYAKANSSLRTLRGETNDIEEELETLMRKVQKGPIESTYSESFSERCNRHLSLFKQPNVWKPFLLISALIIIQQFSGMTLIRKYVLTIFQATFRDSKHGSNKNLPYYAAIAIGFFRFFSNLGQTKLLKTFRRRTMYFSSLWLTFTSLIILGILSFFGSNTSDFRVWGIVGVMIIHVFSVQMGLQVMATMMSAILFPNDMRAIMKGMMKAINSTSSILVLSILPLRSGDIMNPNGIDLPGTFWSMAAVLILSSPLFYFFLPEIKDVSLSFAGEFFSGVQNELFYTDDEVDIIATNDDDVSNRMSCEISEPQPLYDLRSSKQNIARINFIRNRFSQRYQKFFLCGDQNRLLIANCTVSCPDSIFYKQGAIFLYDDILILGKRFGSTPSFVTLVAFELRDPIFQVKEVEEDSNGLELVNGSSSQIVSFNSQKNRDSWQGLIKHWQILQPRLKGRGQAKLLLTSL